MSNGTFPFSQPAWTPESGRAFPGAEEAAAKIEADAEAAAIASQAKTEKAKHLARKQGVAEAEATDALSRQLVVTRADTITPTRTRWLWAPGADGHGRIPMGEVTLIVGRGGVGKSTLLATMTAWITTGDMQGEFWAHPRDVIYVANEDSLKSTVVPRLIAAGADLSRVHFVTMSHAGQEARVMLPTDCAAVGGLARESGAVAVMLDPMTSNLKLENGNDSKQMRAVIEAVRRMCEQYDMAAIGLAHTRKADSKNLMDAIMGSSELGNVSRSAMGVMSDPDEEGTVVLSQEKSNLGRLDVPSYRYRIEGHAFLADELISTSRLVFLGKTDQKVSEMLAESMTNMGGASSVKECSGWLVEYIEYAGNGVPPRVPRAEIIAEGRKQGYQEHTLKRAASKRKIQFLRQGFPSTSVWALPEVTDHSSQNTWN